MTVVRFSICTKAAHHVAAKQRLLRFSGEAWD
jgi:hypothetical protein